MPPAVSDQSIGARSIRRAAYIAIAATFLALFFATKDSIHQATLGLQITWVKNLWWKAMEWYGWALLAPVIFLFCRRFDLSKKPWRTVVAQLGCAAVVALLHCCLLASGARIEAQILQTGMSWPGLFKFIFANHFHENVLTYAAIVSAWYAFDYYNRLCQRERQTAELQAHLAQARLQTLKAQLQPHFLFNTLNGIAALVYEDPKTAHRMLARLSELLRLSLADEGAQQVTLQAELDFGTRYLELEKIRFGDKLSVNTDIAPETLLARVPNLLLQPLLENAIKHAISPSSKPGSVLIRSRRDNERLLLCVADTGPGHNRATLSQGYGIGLNHTKARLRELYGSNQCVELKQNSEGGLAVEISIPFWVATDTCHV